MKNPFENYKPPEAQKIAPLRFQDYVPKVIQDFQIKPPQTFRIWKEGKKDLQNLESKVAYIKESLEAFNEKCKKEGKHWEKKELKDYTGLLITLLFKKPNPHIKA